MIEIASKERKKKRKQQPLGCELIFSEKMEASGGGLGNEGWYL